jgi:hypothetical protein
MNALITAAIEPHNNLAAITSALTDRECDLYRAQAAECEQISGHWPDLLRQQYQELARQWRTLAQQSERRAKTIKVN